MLHHYGNNHDHGAGTFFSLLFPLSGRSSTSTSTYDNNASPANYVDNAPVDCTLSLATPSTRHACTHSQTTSVSSDVVSIDQSNSNSNSNSNAYTSARHFNKSAGGSAKEADASARLSQRRCANCDTTSTPLWRNGPRGPKSLCNACGIRFKKEERRAAAAAAVSPMLDCTSGYISGYSYQNQSTSHQQQQSWGCYASTVGKGSGFTSYGDDTSESRDLPYMPWRLNIVQPQPFPVIDRTGLYQYN